MSVWTVDIQAKEAICTGDNALVDFSNLARVYGKPMLQLSAGHPFFIADGWLFKCEPPK